MNLSPFTSKWKNVTKENKIVFLNTETKKTPRFRKLGTRSGKATYPGSLTLRHRHVTDRRTVSSVTVEEEKSARIKGHVRHLVLLLPNVLHLRLRALRVKPLVHRAFFTCTVLVPPIFVVENRHRRKFIFSGFERLSHHLNINCTALL